jgi:hypothetical protein
LRPLRFGAVFLFLYGYGGDPVQTRGLRVYVWWMREREVVVSKGLDETTRQQERGEMWSQKGWMRPRERRKEGRCGLKRAG